LKSSIFIDVGDLFVSVKKKYFTDIGKQFFIFKKIFAVNTYKILADNSILVVYTCPLFVDISTVR